MLDHFIVKSRFNTPEYRKLTFPHVGWGNGYVIVDHKHPLFKVSYNDFDIPVHGGLTYSKLGIKMSNWEELPDKYKTDKFWIFGFDTGHYMDNLKNWPKKAVLEETLRLKHQLRVYPDLKLIEKVITETKINMKTKEEMVVTTKTTKVKKTAISRTAAVELMENSRGRFLTVEYTKKNGDHRKINCQYLKDQSKSKLGFVRVKEACKLKTTPTDCIRNIDSRTIMFLKANGNEYKIK